MRGVFRQIGTGVKPSGITDPHTRYEIHVRRKMPVTLAMLCRVMPMRQPTAYWKERSLFNEEIHRLNWLGYSWDEARQRYAV